MAEVLSAICFGGLTGKTVTLTIASPCVVSLATHGLRPGAGIQLSTSGALPTGLVPNTTYYVGNVARGTFNLYDTKANAIAGGATGKINTSGTQSGTHTVKSAVMLATDLSRYGSTRVYDGIASWNSGRSGASAYDTEIAEVLEPFTDTLTAKLTLSIPSAKSILTSKINGARGAGFHGGVKPTSSLTTLALENGYVLATETWLSNYLLTLNRYRDTLDGICLINAAAGGVYNMVKLAAGQARLANCIVYCITPNNGGVYMSAALSECVNNRIYGFSGVGIDIVGSVSAGVFVCNNTVVKNGTGLQTQTSALGFYYNNVIVGNTTNWSPATMPTGVEGASNNCTPTGQGWSKGGGPLINIATTDFADYANNNFYPASVSSPQVESGISPYGYPTEDIAGRERPNYMNGGAEAMDIGADEFDHGYGNHPATATINLTSIVSGSQVRITKDTDGAVIYNNAPGASLAFSTSYIGGFSVTVRKASASPYYREFNASGTTVAGQTTTIKCLQQLDE